MKKILGIAMIASFGFAGSAYAQAQTAPTPAPAAQQVQVSEAKVKEFVEVHQEVYEISTKYQAQLQATNDPDEVSTISQQANQEMAAIVEKSPLSIQEYNQYAMLLQQDQDFQKLYQEQAK